MQCAQMFEPCYTYSLHSVASIDVQSMIQTTIASAFSARRGPDFVALPLAGKGSSQANRINQGSALASFLSEINWLQALQDARSSIIESQCTGQCSFERRSMHVGGDGRLFNVSCKHSDDKQDLTDYLNLLRALDFAALWMSRKRSRQGMESGDESVSVSVEVLASGVEARRKYLELGAWGRRCDGIVA